MAQNGARPLTGLRVLELATGVAGPYAGRLLAMLGATVAKVEPGGGDPARTLPVDDQPPAGLSPAFVHLNAGKRLVREGAVDLGAAVGWADVVLDNRVRRQVAGTALDPDRRRDRRPGQVLASVTAWGFDAEEAGDPDDEVRVQAASGALTGTPDEAGRPLRLPGWQSQYLAGTYAAAGALALLGDTEHHHLDVSWLGAVLSGVEVGLCTHLHASSADPAVAGEADTEGAARQRGLQAQVFPAGAFRCADGFVVPGTVRPIDWELQCKVYGRPDLLEDDRFTWRGRWDNRADLVAELQPWYDARTRREIFAAGLEAGWAVAMVLGAGDLLEDPHVAGRGFLSEVTGAARAVVPGRPWRMHGLSEGEPVRLAETGADDSWFAAATASPSRGNDPDEEGPPRPPPAGRLRLLELTWAWAGPFVGRFLGPLGADVVKVETGRFPDGWRTRLRWRQAGVRIPEGVDPDAYTWDAAALFNALNRSKRTASVDLTHAEGRQVFLRLVRAADALVLNMNHRVLSDRGVEDEVLAAVDEGLVVVTMPALGATGPYRAMPGYGTLMEGMGGFAARFGHPDEGARVSGTYYPDAVAGVHGVVAVLAALAHRERTGRGSFVDLSQQETTWLQLGEGLALRTMEGRDPARTEAVPGVPVTSWVEAHADGTLEARGLIERLDHPVTGRRDHLRVPLRVDGRLLDSPRAAPVFDQHTDEVLGEWAGLDPAAIAALRASGAVGSTPTARRR